VLRLSGDPAMLILNVDAPPEAIAAFRHAWGLGQPVWVHYLASVENVAVGDLGQSMREAAPRPSWCGSAFPPPYALAIPALLIKIGVGIPSGVYAALHRGTWIDRAVMAAAVAGFAVPSFVPGLVPVLVFAVQLGWLPSGGQDQWLGPVLPVITPGVGGAAILARFTRSAMLAVLGQPYIRVLSRLVVSIRISLLIAFGATAMAAILGTLLGFLAAQFRGWVEQVVLMVIDFQAALPFLILALAVLAFFGNSPPLFVCLMGLYGWERHARIARGLAISADAQGYAAAIRQLGASPRRVYLRHLLPNIASTLIVSATLSFPEIILLESGLSFLGLGIQPPMTSLGDMIGYGREYLTRAPWILLRPSAVAVLTTFAVSVVGDWLRDRLDPTLS
jgi:peptide/nickel transport system permease protein